MRWRRSNEPVIVTRGGRPLRFLAVTLGCWIGMRMFVLWPVAIVPGVASGPAIKPQVLAATISPVAIIPATPLVEAVKRPQGGLRRSATTTTAALPARLSPAFGNAAVAPGSAAALALAALVRYGDAITIGPMPGIIPPPFAPPPLATPPARLAGSAWLLARGGAGGTLLGGQLGASQAGVRLTYALGDARRIALSARVATPLRGRGAEAAAGLDWQPTSMPLHLLAEERFSLDGGRGGPTLLVIGGVNPTEVAAGFRLEAYGEAGAIKRDGVEAFGDGAARLTHRMASRGLARLDLGAGVWGAGQRGVRRLDIGPTVGAVLPVAGRALRITADWRARIAGNASPGSGPALSIGTDF